MHVLPLDAHYSLPHHPHMQTVVRAMSQVFASWRANQPQGVVAAAAAPGMMEAAEWTGKRMREGGGGAGRRK